MISKNNFKLFTKVGIFLMIAFLFVISTPLFIANASNITMDGESVVVNEINLDENGEINTRNRNGINGQEFSNFNEADLSNLGDGLYVIDYKNGWVRGNDAGLLTLSVIPSGVNGSIVYSESKGFDTSEITKISGGLSLSFVTSLVNYVQGNTFSESKQISVAHAITSPEGMNTLVKAHTVYHRNDVIKIANGVIVEHVVTYKPMSSVIRFMQYQEGTVADQQLIYEEHDINVLGNPEYTTTQVIEENIDQYFTIGVNSNEVYRNMYDVIQQNTVGINLTVSQSGNYNIYTKMLPMSSADIKIATGMNMALYEKTGKNMDLISQIPYNFRYYSRYGNTPLSDPFNVYLESGKQYVLLLNTDKRYVWDVNDRYSILYQLLFRKV